MSGFATKLLAEARTGEVEDSEFLSCLSDGTCSPEQIRLYGFRMAQGAARATVILGSILTHCPHRAIRSRIIENLIDEEGFASPETPPEIVERRG